MAEDLKRLQDHSEVAVTTARKMAAYCEQLRQSALLTRPLKRRPSPRPGPGDIDPKNHFKTRSREEENLKSAILAQYSHVSDGEVTDSDQEEESGGGIGLKNTNAEEVYKAEREKREKDKEESQRKKEKDKEDRAKQKSKDDERKEKEKKRTQKGERRR
nr:coiled-coil domain-containing protein 43-like [Procambarus clarkii]